MASATTPSNRGAALRPGAQISDEDRKTTDRGLSKAADAPQAVPERRPSLRTRSTAARRPCPSHKEAASIERRLAEETLSRSQVAAAGFWGAYPTVARRESAQIPGAPYPDYFFARLYEFITYEELQQAASLAYPGFVYHLMKVFYDLYDDAVVRRDRTGGRSRSTPLWDRYLGLVAYYERSSAKSVNDLLNVIDSAARAHILGDLGEALARTYVHYRDTYCPTVLLNDLHGDFFGATQKGLFEKVTARFYAHIMQITPSWVPIEQGQLLLWMANQIGGLLTGNELWSWRQAAWRQATRMVDQRVE